MSLNICVCVCVYIYLYIYVYMLLRVFFVTSLVAQLVKNPPTRQEIPVWFLGQEDPWRKIGYTLIFLGFHGGSDSKESSCNSGDPGLIPGLGRSPREGNDYPLQYSGLENSMDRGAWKAIVHGIEESNMTQWLSLSKIREQYDVTLERTWVGKKRREGGKWMKI